MFVFGHIGITTGLIQSLNSQRLNQAPERKIDLRRAALFSLLPDLVDKPVGIIYRNLLGNHTRLWGHSLVFSLLILSGLLVLRRRRQAMILWLCCAGHLLLDRIWIADLGALLWPFRGFGDTAQLALTEKWLDALQQPWTIFGETLGLGILIFFIFNYRLFEPGPRSRFLRTGLLSAPRNRST